MEVEQWIKMCGRHWLLKAEKGRQDWLKHRVGEVKV